MLMLRHTGLSAIADYPAKPRAPACEKSPWTPEASQCCFMRFLESLFVNHQSQSHNTSHEDRAHQQICQNSPDLRTPPRPRPVSNHPRPGCAEKPNGKSSSSPSPAPSREAFNPAHPPASTFTETPTRNPGTVSQFGIRRLRQSVHPAISANATASPSTVGFKPPPTWSSQNQCPRSSNAATSPTGADFHIAGCRSQ